MSLTKYFIKLDFFFIGFYFLSLFLNINNQCVDNINSFKFMSIILLPILCVLINYNNL